MSKNVFYNKFDKYVLSKNVKEKMTSYWNKGSDLKSRVKSKNRVSWK